MKLERISENQIKCYVSSGDLATRQLSFRELAYGSDKVRKLFADMLEEAGATLDFHPEGTPLMIEAVPMGSEGLLVFITKVEDPEELDTRFARFAPAIMAQMGSASGESSTATHSNAEDILRAFGRMIDLAAREINQNHEEPRAEDPQDLYRAFFFEDMDSARAAARLLTPHYSGPASFYGRPSGGYYLVLHKAESDTVVFNKLCNLLTEYAAQVRVSCMSEAYYREHYRIIYDGDAIPKLSGR